MLRRVATWAGDEAWSVLELARAGLIRPLSPGQLARVLRALHAHGELGAALTLAAVRYPDEVGLIDERGELTFAELDARSNALANEWRRLGLRPGETVAVLARNHRGFVDALFAGLKTGARVVLLNTDFSAKQVSEVIAREGADVLVYDDEYAGTVAGTEPRLGNFRAWADKQGVDTIDDLIERGDTSSPPPATVKPTVIILTRAPLERPRAPSDPSHDRCCRWRGYWTRRRSVREKSPNAVRRCFIRSGSAT
jgi:fatty-acyl-CoA synthase